MTQCQNHERCPKCNKLNGDSGYRLGKVNWWNTFDPIININAFIVH